ncbi:MAG: hypothetical protein CSA76_05580 [Spirochaetales bacterium]|nr:MAG: hypothetical protein CSA76_05580 [Spirochaetales bacterium]
MSRKILPILISAAGVLLVALLVIIAMMLVSPEQRRSRSIRAAAVQSLLSRSGSLADLSAAVSAPVSPGGSIDNLYHFMQKDPGRAFFPRSADRRRAEAYLEGMEPVDSSGPSAWSDVYAASVAYLFSKIITDVFAVTGFPRELTELQVPPSGEASVSELELTALREFAQNWIPPGQTVSAHTVDRQLVRQWLLSKKRYHRRMNSLDQSWADLSAALYNLLTNERWLAAVSEIPELEEALDELIVTVVSADLYRRRRNQLMLISGSGMPEDAGSGAGIRWTPDFSYYKNIPEITGTTSGPDPAIFFARVSLGYTYRDARTQTWLNQRKTWLTDYFSEFFSSIGKEDFSPIQREDIYLADWKAAVLKANAIHGINSYIAASYPFGVRKVYGVRDLAFVRVNLISSF